MVKKFQLEWRKGNTERWYVNGTGVEIQIGKYRDMDDFDKYMNHKPTWQGKWYVDVFNYNTKLFNTKKEAEKYLVYIRNKIYDTKQLK
jgi:hypothetical protein